MKGEIDRIEKIQRAARLPRGSRVAVGIGDDCAIYRPRRSAEDLLLTTDMLLDGVHFRRETHTPDAVGHKALARALSDIAAMGGEPRFCLLSLAAGPEATDRWLDGFYRGFLKLAEATGTPLAGGDLARAPRTGCDVVVCGAVPRGTALLRSGARTGDRIYVSGMLGGSALGLRTGKGREWRRHTHPEPRLGLGLFLRRSVHASAAMDLSDGLSLDLRRLCLASGVSATIEAPPRYPGASEADALHGGEDYELLFTAPPGARVPDAFEGLPLSNIGTLRKGRPGLILLRGNPLPPLGYDHFREG